MNNLLSAPLQCKCNLVSWWKMHVHFHVIERLNLWQNEWMEQYLHQNDAEAYSSIRNKDNSEGEMPPTYTVQKVWSYMFNELILMVAP